MGIFSRFFGASGADDPGEGKLVANPTIEHPLSLQVLFAESCLMNPERLAASFRAYHSSMARVRSEFDPALNREGKLFGMIGWGRHVVRCIGFDQPMPAEAVEACVAPAHYSQEWKQRARAHKAHVILYYAGYDASPLEQYVALAATAGVMARLGAIVVLNESAHTSIPAAALSEVDGDMMDFLRTLPLLILYCGFVKHEVEGIAGVWMRTYGAPLLGLPDLAAHAAGHHQGQRYFDMFESVLGYLLESGAQLAAGHTMQIGQEEFLRFRGPTEEEAFLDSGGELLVAETISADEINRED